MPALSALERLVPVGIRARGDRYYEEQRVGAIARQADGRIFAEVRGSTDYSVSISAADGELEYACDCPFYEQNLDLCKHVWAVLRRAQRDGLLRFDAIEIIGPSDDAPEIDAKVVPFTPRRRAEWLDRLERLPGVEPPSAETEGEIVYVLAAPSAATLQVTPHVRRPRRDGSLGKPRPFQPTHADIAQLPEPDREILGLLYLDVYAPESTESSSFFLRGEGKKAILAKMAATGRLYLDLDDDLAGPLEWEAEPWALHLRAENGDRRAGLRLTGALRRGTESVALDGVDVVMAGAVLLGNRLAPLRSDSAGPWIESLARAPIEVPESDRDEFVAALVARAPAEVDLPPELRKRVERPTPEPRLLLVRGGDREGEGWTGTFTVRYDDVDVVPGEGGPSIAQPGRIILRDLVRERDFIARLGGLRVVRDYFGAWRIRASQEAEVLPALAREGWTVELHGKPLRVSDDLRLEIESGIDWFDLRAEVRFGDVALPVSELLETAASGLRKLPDGSFGLVKEGLLEGLEFLEGVDPGRNGRYRFKAGQALLIDLLLRARNKVKTDRDFAALRDRLVRGGEIEPKGEPEGFTGTLRAYQREGLGWLEHLRGLGIGGCLADDMGLGKTVQVLALFASLDRDRPSLVVAPRSLLFNWKEEAARFVPGLNVVEHHGADRSVDDLANAGLVLTTYGTLRADIAHLSAIDFEYVVLDEAQAIKNASSQTAKAARLLEGTHRLALSGTPIENHLGELWSLFEFLEPGMLGPSKWFRKQFAGRSVAPERLETLATALRPLILRRTKEQVAPELPPRVEQTLWCELDAEQAKIYEQLRLSYRASLLDKVKSEGMQSARMHVLEALLRLRQAACDPALLDPATEIEGAKLEVLLEELAEVIDSGHRALVFSQFTSFLSLAAKRLEKQRIRYAWLDGRTVDRQRVVREFQAPDGPPVFLISLKAGGTGLNLTSADYVFLLDPWWNPAVEAQAIDRTHRIGQEKPVFAYRIIARGTVEEKILELQESKRELADSILTEDNSVLRSLDLETLERLLS
ncbi:MAG: SNF2-related protein [Thermoanaerobaculia bacterium]